MKRHYLSKDKRSKSLLAMTIDSIKRESKINIFSSIMDKDIFKEDFRSSSNKNILTQRSEISSSLRNINDQKSQNKKFEFNKKIIKSIKEETVNKGNY